MRALKRTHSPPWLEGEVLREANRLFDLQVWLWGQDVLHTRGNGLIRFGFDRHPAPANTQATSMYRLPLSHGRRVTLRGFGLFYSDCRLGRIFLERFVFQPRWTATLDLPDNAWFRPLIKDLRCPVDAPTLKKCQRLLRGAIRWIIRYEDWAWTTLGHAHRQRAVAKWRELNKPVVPAGTLSEAWANWIDRVK